MARLFPKSTVVYSGSLLAFILCVAILVAPALVQAQQSRAVESAPTSRPPEAAATGPAFESEYCEVLYRFNSEKKIGDPKVRNRFAGQYNQADDPQRLRTWSVETACGEFLVAVPLWALRLAAGPRAQGRQHVWGFDGDDLGVSNRTGRSGHGCDHVRFRRKRL